MRRSGSRIPEVSWSDTSKGHRDGVQESSRNPKKILWHQQWRSWWAIRSISTDFCCKLYVWWARIKIPWAYDMLNRVWYNMRIERHFLQGWILLSISRNSIKDLGFDTVELIVLVYTEDIVETWSNCSRCSIECTTKKTSSRTPLTIADIQSSCSLQNRKKRSQRTSSPNELPQCGTVLLTEEVVSAPRTDWT